VCVSHSARVWMCVSHSACLRERESLCVGFVRERERDCAREGLCVCVSVCVFVCACVCLSVCLCGYAAVFVQDKKNECV